MLSTVTCWDALVDDLKKLGHFQEVKPLPMEKVQNAAFFQSLPSLKLPAGIVIWRGRASEVKGSGRYRENHWSLVTVVKDVKGAGYRDNLEIVDKLAGSESDRFLDRQILDDELTILGSHNVAVAVAHESISILELTFDTREAAAR